MYAATIEALHLTFQVFGVWRKNLVMRDHQTGTIWQHATGEAIDGPLKGCQLEVRAGWETTWGLLRRTYPESCYALTPHKFPGLIPKSILQHMLGITHRASLSGLSSPDKRLRPHDIIIGVVVSGSAKAYPLEVLRAQKNVVDQVGGETIRLVYDVAGDQITVVNPQGVRLQHERQWWSGWSEFHPRSELYGEKTHVPVP